MTTGPADDRTAVDPLDAAQRACRDGPACPAPLARTRADRSAPRRPAAQTTGPEPGPPPPKRPTRRSWITPTASCPGQPSVSTRSMPAGAVSRPDRVLGLLMVPVATRLLPASGWGARGRAPDRGGSTTPRPPATSMREVARLATTPRRWPRRPGQQQGQPGTRRGGDDLTHEEGPGGPGQEGGHLPALQAQQHAAPLQRGEGVATVGLSHRCSRPAARSGSPPAVRPPTGG